MVYNTRRRMKGTGNAKRKASTRNNRQIEELYDLPLGDDFDVAMYRITPSPPRSRHASPTESLAADMDTLNIDHRPRQKRRRDDFSLDFPTDRVFDEHRRPKTKKQKSTHRGKRGDTSGNDQSSYYQL